MLGNLRVWDGAAWSPVRADQQRIVLAVLLTEAGRVVSTDRLVDEIWGECPPRTAVVTLQGYVSRLRRLIGGGPRGPLLTRGRGYELSVQDGDLDVEVFERLVGSTRRSPAAGDLDAAVAAAAGAAVGAVHAGSAPLWPAGGSTARVPAGVPGARRRAGRGIGI